MYDIGIYYPSPDFGGQSRYIESLLRYAASSSLTFLVYGHPSGPFASRSDIGFVSLAESPVEQSRDNLDASTAHRTSFSPLLKSAFRCIVPTPCKIWSAYGKSSFSLARRFRTRAVRLLHTNQTGCEESAIAARIAGIPRVVGTFHIDPSYDLSRVRIGPTHRIVEHLSNHLLDLAIAVSGQTAQDWIRWTHLPARKVLTIHNGIDADQFHRRSAKSIARGKLGIPVLGPVIGSMGRLEEVKGFAYLIEALPLLLPTHPDLIIAIAGGGPLRDALMQRVAELGVTSNVRFLGFCSNVQMFYDALDVFVLPSLCETLGYVLLEAMATQLPVVATCVGGVPEVVQEGETGLLVRPRDPHSLAKAISVLLGSEQTQRRFGAAGRQRVVKHFQEKIMAERTLEAYRKLLGPRLPNRTAAERRGFE